MRLHLIVVTVFVASALLVPNAAADIDRPEVCEVVIHGERMSEHSDRDKDDAIKIPSGTDFDHSLTTTQGHPIDRWTINLHYGPIPIPLDDGVPEGDGDRFEDSGTVESSSYSWVGRGYYRVSAEVHLQDGTKCTGSSLVQITGSPVTSLLGWVGFLFIGLGLLGVVLGFVKNSDPSKATFDLDGPAAGAGDEHGPPKEPPGAPPAE